MLTYILKDKTLTVFNLKDTFFSPDVSICGFQVKLSPSSIKHLPLTRNQAESSIPVRYLEDVWQFGTCLSGRLGSAGLTAGLDDFKVLSQPKQFCDYKLNHRSGPIFVNYSYFISNRIWLYVGNG